MTNATPAADQELDTRLAVIQQTVSAIANPVLFIEDIENELDILAEDQADPEALQAINANAIALLDTQQRFASAFKSAIEIATALRAQRETTRTRLRKLEKAIDECDIEVPEIELLAEAIREEQDEYLWLVLDEMLADQIACGIGIPLGETVTLVNCLTSGDLLGHYLVDALRDWVRRADEYIRTGITPPPDTDE